MFDLNKFDDLVLLNIFKQLNLNERSNLKCVSKRFNYLVDLLSISKLVIFDRSPTIQSKYKFSNEFWQQADIVFVTDLNKFIKKFENKLEKVKKLVIFSVNNGVHVIEINFKELIHLELYDITLSSAKILSSKKLVNYYHHEVFFNSRIALNVNKLKNASISSQIFNCPSDGLAYQLEQIDYLKLEEITFLINLDLIPTQLNLKQIKIATNLRVAESFWNKFKSLKVFELLLVGLGGHDVEKDLHRLKRVIAKKRDDLDLYIWGVKVNQETIKDFLRFYHSPMACLTTFIFRRVNLHFEQCGIFKHLEDHNHLLEKFYELIEIITIQGHINAQKEFFERMVNLRDIYLNLVEDDGSQFEKLLTFFPLLNRLEITQAAKTSLSDIFYSIPVHCKNISHLKIYCFEVLKFDFLFQMKNLKYLILNLYHPIKNEIVFELIKNLKYLAFLQIHFLKTEDDISNENLKQFKAEVNSLIQNELKFKEANFTILINRKKLGKQKSDFAVLRYKYERSNFVERRFDDTSLEDLENLWSVIKIKGIQRPRQIVFNDRIVTKILSFLNLNERTNCRLVSDQFKRCADKVPIYKLVIFSLIRCNPGKFRLTNETFDLQDCVYVCDVKKFLKSHQILRCMTSIRKLIIYGLNEIIELLISFEKLEYLELHRIFCIGRGILESPNIKTFFSKSSCLSNPNFFEPINRPSQLSEFDFIGLNKLKCKLRHFGHDEIMDNEIDFYKNCVQKKIFDELDVLDCRLKNFETLVYISKNFKNLEQINVRFGENFHHFRSLLHDDSLSKLQSKLRDNLKVNIFGIRFEQSTVQTINRFFLKYSNNLQMDCDLVLCASDDWDTFKNLFGDKEELFEEFFSQIRTLQFIDNLKDKSFFDRFKNIEYVCYYFQTPYRFNLPESLEHFPKMNALLFNCCAVTSYDNRILDAIPNYCPQITKLILENWEKNCRLDFLLKLPNLSELRINLRFPIDQSLFIEIVRTLKYLLLFEIYYEKPSNLSKDQLSSFKKLVNQCLKEELKLKDSIFKIEIHTKTLDLTDEEFKLCRYVFVRSHLHLSKAYYETNLEVINDICENLNWKRNQNTMKNGVEEFFLKHFRF